MASSAALEPAAVISAVTPATFRWVTLELKPVAAPADHSHMDVASIALQGLSQSETQLDAAASSLVDSATGTSGSANLDTLDLSTNILELIAAQTQFSIDLSTVKAAEQVQQSTIDLLA